MTSLIYQSISGTILTPEKDRGDCRCFFLLVTVVLMYILVKPLDGLKWGRVPPDFIFCQFTFGTWLNIKCVNPKPLSRFVYRIWPSLRPSRVSWLVEIRCAAAGFSACLNASLVNLSKSYLTEIKLLKFLRPGSFGLSIACYTYLAYPLSSDYGQIICLWRHLSNPLFLFLELFHKRENIFSFFFINY